MATTEMNFTISIPQTLYLELHEVAVSRARRDGGVPPRLKTLVCAAVEEFVRREAATGGDTTSSPANSTPAHGVRR